MQPLIEKPANLTQRIELKGLAKHAKTCELTGMDTGLAFQEEEPRVFLRICTCTDPVLQSKSSLPTGYSNLLLSLKQAMYSASSIDLAIRCFFGHCHQTASPLRCETWLWWDLGPARSSVQSNSLFPVS